MNTNIDIENALGYNLGTTFFALGSLLSKNLSKHRIDLTQKQAKMLMFLGHYEGVKQQELACILQKDKPTITKMVDLLEKKALVVRKKDASDRRNRLLYLTDSGKKLRKHIIPVVQATLNEAVGGLDEDEYRQLIRSLKKVRTSIQKKLEENE